MWLRKIRVSSYFQRLDAFRWTPYMDECIAVLAEKKEQSTDTLLIYLVKLQLIVEKIAQAPWHEGCEDAIDSVRAPPTFYLKALQAQLQDCKANIPPEIQGNRKNISGTILPDTTHNLPTGVLLLHLYSTEVKAHEVAFLKTPPVVNSPGFQRLDCLYACLYATKSWFDLFLSLPPDSYIGFSISIFIQMAHCIIALFRLSTFDDPIWDRSLVQVRTFWSKIPCLLVNFGPHSTV